MKVLISDRAESMAPDPDRERERLAALLPGATVVHHPYVDDAVFRRELADADALLTAFLSIDAATIAAAERLRCISLNATGYDVVDLDAARARGIAVMCIGEYCTIDVAEHTIALLGALHAGLKRFWIDVDGHGRWDYQAAGRRRRLTGQRLGIVGLGRIGTAVADRARGLGLDVIAHDPFIDPAHAAAHGVALVGRDELLATSDVVSNHMDATAENRHWFDAAAFAAMERSPLLINTARGWSMDHDALAAALDAGQVSAAGLDVIESEKPDLARHRLAHRDNVIITPHAAFYSDESAAALVDISTANIAHYLNGDHEHVNKRVA